MKKPYRVLVLFDTDGEPPASQDYKKQVESTDEAEFDVARALIQKGHQVRLLGFRDNPEQLIAGLRAEPADVVFNLSERFRGESALDYTVAAVLEMLGLPYTGASSEGLMLARDKALTKKVFAYQGIRIPHFMVCPHGDPVQRPSDLRFPLIVKPLDEDASVGHRAVVGGAGRRRAERAGHLHPRSHQDRRDRRGVHRRARALHRGHGQRAARVAPADRDGVRQRLDRREPDRDLQGQVERPLSREPRHPERDRQEPVGELRQRLGEVAVRAYQAAGLRDYGRIDVRLAHDEAIYIVEANPNPYLADGEDLAWAAEEAGHVYPDFIEQIAEMAIKRHAARR